MKIPTIRVFALTCGTAAAAVAAGAALLVTSEPADATMQFAQTTGKSCTYCHTEPAGGANLTAAGEAFKANGNKLPK